MIPVAEQGKNLKKSADIQSFLYLAALPAFFIGHALLLAA